MTRFLMAAILATTALATPALAQDSRVGFYDGRAIANWAYSPEGSEITGLPTWYSTSGDTLTDGANCNIGIGDLEASRAEVDAYFASMTPQIYTNQLRANGTDVRGAYLTEVFEMSGRPVMRNLFTATANDTMFDSMTLAIGGRDHLLTITCSVTAGRLLDRLQDFYAFGDQMIITIVPPQ